MKHRREQRHSSSSSPRSPSDPFPSSELDMRSSDLFYIQLHTLLRELGNELSGQSNGVVKRVCQEISAFTRGYASLQLYQHSSETAINDSFPASSPCYSVPVLHAWRDYGRLFIFTDPVQPSLPWQAPSTAQVMAEQCAGLLYRLETTLYFQQLANMDVQEREPMSARLLEVLALMCQGQSDAAIAQKLTIDKETVRTHRATIYARLHVHSRHQAIVTGFAAALYSPIEGLAPRLSISPETSHLT